MEESVEEVKGIRVARKAPKGWKCIRDGHIPDEDFPPGGPHVQATREDGTIAFFAVPGGRCRACDCIFAWKEEVPAPSEIVGPNDPGGRIIKPS